MATKKYCLGNNLDFHYAMFLKYTKPNKNDIAPTMRGLTRNHFIQSLLEELMREAGVYKWVGKEDMLGYLNK